MCDCLLMIHLTLVLHNLWISIQCYINVSGLNEGNDTGMGRWPVVWARVYTLGLSLSLNLWCTLFRVFWWRWVSWNCWERVEEEEPPKTTVEFECVTGGWRDTSASKEGGWSQMVHGMIIVWVGTDSKSCDGCIEGGVVSPLSLAPWPKNTLLTT